MKKVEKLINNWNDKQYLVDGNTRNFIMLDDGSEWEKPLVIVWCGSGGTITGANNLRDLYDNLIEWIERNN